MIRMQGAVAPMKPAILYFPDGSRDPFPCALTGDYGTGRVVYFAGGVDAAYFSYGYPYQRILLSRAVQWAAREPYPLTVKAPMCVQSTFWSQNSPDGPRLIVHLWNGLNTTSDHGLQEVETPLREEAVPIHGIQLHLTHPPAGPIHAQPEGLLLSPRNENNTWIIDVPPVAIHSAIVVPLPPR